jgi:hypothetical protein
MLDHEGGSEVEKLKRGITKSVWKCNECGKADAVTRIRTKKNKKMM